MTGIVAQVSISPGGVPNRAVNEGRLTTAGIEGDGWRHPQFHGTRRRAILLVTAEGVDELAARGVPVFYGALGENLTTRGLDRYSLRVGQRFRVGAAAIRLTEVRVPCNALKVYGHGLRAAIFDERAMAGDPATPVWGMSGFYASVVQPGVLRAGDAIAMMV